MVGDLHALCMLASEVRNFYTLALLFSLIGTIPPRRFFFQLPTISFLLLKNTENPNFSSSNFRKKSVSRNQSCISRQKKIDL
jgi:hypothetical protein